MSAATEVDMAQRAPGATRGASGSPVAAAVDYPDSDGEPMADNTLQFEWIVRLKENLDAMLPDFVAGDHLWYPVEGRPEVRIGPDVMVCLGRPKGYRGSYMQFREDGVPPAVVFEVLSPRNTEREMVRKGAFYFRHGVREFIVVDPDRDSGWAMVRSEGGEPEDVPTLDGWTSPTLGIRFVRGAAGLEVYRPDGTRFLSFPELEAQQRAALAEAERARFEADTARAEADTARIEAVTARTEADTARIEAVTARTEADTARIEAVTARTEADTARAEAEDQAARARAAEARAARLAEKLASLGLNAEEL